MCLKFHMFTIYLLTIHIVYLRNLILEKQLYGLRVIIWDSPMNQMMK